MRKCVFVRLGMAGLGTMLSLVSLLSLVGACTGASTTTPTEPSAVSIAGPTQFTSVGQTGQLVVNAAVGGVPIQESAEQCNWTSSNPGVATVTSPGGLVTAVSAGTSTITVSSCATTTGNPTATIGVTVALTALAYEALNGEYVGNLSPTSAALPPCTAAGLEIVMINVDASGVGTLEVSDSFTRVYPILIPPSLTFTSQEVFLNAGATLSGTMVVTIPSPSATALAYQETLSASGCQTVLSGTLTKQ
jgi:hypothetical protein